jgi:FADH2 O2-dependent halogenase
VTSVYDIAVVGSAFGGSLMAMIARRLGRSVLLLERGRHPRFAIGESSTPLSNLLLESLSRRFDLPAIAPLAKWGTWQRHHPGVAGGLKRGFTFLHHRFSESFPADAAGERELLVAASPTDAIADTHWYRPDVDHLFQREAVALGVAYEDEVQLNAWDENAGGVVLHGTRHGLARSYRARFLIDASGPRGFLHTVGRSNELEIPGVTPNEALYSHFTGVARWEGLHPSEAGAPFPADDAALHHVFPGGWMWVLRFNQGITSAGISVRPELAAELNLAEGEPAWNRLLERLPSVHAQFRGASTTMPFRHLRRMAFRSPPLRATRCARLPSAVGFVDPLLSTGFALNLLGVDRLATLLQAGDLASPAALWEHELATEADLLAAGRMTGGLQAHFDRPAVFSTLLMLYFAAASYSETARRLHRPHLAPGFLLHGHPTFGPESTALLREAVQRPLQASSPDFRERIRRAVAPVDVGGWFDPGRTRWHPVETAPLFRAAPGLESSSAEMEALLRGAGFPEEQCHPPR